MHINSIGSAARAVAFGNSERLLSRDEEAFRRIMAADYKALERLVNDFAQPLRDDVEYGIALKGGAHKNGQVMT